MGTRKGGLGVCRYAGGWPAGTVLGLGVLMTRGISGSGGSGLLTLVLLDLRDEVLDCLNCFPEKSLKTSSMSPRS